MDSILTIFLNDEHGTFVLAVHVGIFAGTSTWPVTCSTRRVTLINVANM
jgi:hypothetical protein